MVADRPAAAAQAVQIVFPTAGSVSLEQVPIPVPADDELVVRIERVGICGTDLHLSDGHIGDPFPLVPGHEFTAVVDSVGVAERRGLAPGDRVAIEMLLPCNSCARCREGRYNLCVQDLDTPGPGRQLGVNIPRTAAPYSGGYASHLVVPAEAIVHRLPESLDPDAAVLVEPLAVACRAIARGRVGLGDTVVVIGLGPVGLLTLAAASAAGASTVIAAGGRPARRALARRFGATADFDARGDDLVEKVRAATGGGADVVIEAAGAVEAQYDALRAVRRGGRVVLAGACGSGPNLRVPSDDLLLTREIDVLPSFLSAGGFEPAIGLLSAGRFPFASLVTHVYPLHDAAAALDAVRRKTEGLIKAVLIPQGVPA